MAEVFLLFQMYVENFEKEKKFSFVQYLDVIALRDNVDRALRRVSLRWM